MRKLKYKRVFYSLLYFSIALFVYLCHNTVGMHFLIYLQTSILGRFYETKSLLICWLLIFSPYNRVYYMVLNTQLLNELLKWFVQEGKEKSKLTSIKCLLYIKLFFLYFLHFMFLLFKKGFIMHHSHVENLRSKGMHGLSIIA